MANWSGTFTITTPGTTATSASPTTLANTGAVWPTGAQSLANFTVRILTGTGAGQERVITSNTATVLTVPTWTTTPDATSTYEIVLILKNNDHVTANLTLSTNIISELEDSATILVDGVYTVAAALNADIRWNKSEATLVTFEANNRTVQGKSIFWNYINTTATKTAPAPQISFIRVRDAAGGIVAAPSTGLGDGTTVHHIWIENISGYAVYGTGAAITTDMYFSNVYCRQSQGGYVQSSAYASTYKQIFEKIWTDDSLAAGPIWVAGTGVPNLVWMRDCVFGNLTNKNIDAGTGKEQRLSNCYMKSHVSAGTIIMGVTTAAAAGAYNAFHNRSISGRMFYGANVVSTATMNLCSNDVTAKTQNASAGIDILNAACYTAATSDNDYIAGNKYASLANVDTTAATTSTASPVQYQNLTAARTNPRSVPNFAETADNVSSGTPGSNTATITFDCANGAVASQSTTVNADSASAQPVVNVVSSAAFRIGMLVEIAYGTARQEIGRILALGAGTITLEDNLTYTHTAVQADDVKPQLRHWGLPFVRYGTASGVYPMQTDLPGQGDWGLVYTGIKTIFDGKTYAWAKIAHSVQLTSLEPDTTYYAQACFYSPLGDVGISSEFSFTTASTANYSDPGVANVRLATTYNFGSPTPNRTGTARIPTVGNVKTGHNYDASDTLTGTYDGSDRWTDPGDANVRDPVAYKANSLTNNKTGRVAVPAAAAVKTGTAFETDAATTGTYDGSERYTDISASIVLTGSAWRYNTTGGDNRAGALVAPSTAAIAAAVWSENLSGYTVSNTAGLLLRRVHGLVKTLLGLFFTK